MYHDAGDVRTADDAVLTIRLMVFFEIVDIEQMLDTTHDPIGDFVNAATSDVVELTGKHEFESFKKNTEKLNELETYKQLIVRVIELRGSGGNGMHVHLDEASTNGASTPRSRIPSTAPGGGDVEE